LDRRDSRAALGFANRVEPRRARLGLWLRAAAAGAQRGSGSCRRLCVCDCCRRHGCVKAFKAAGKLKSSKKSKRRMTRLGGVWECGTEQNQPNGCPGAVRSYFLCGFIEVFGQLIFAWRGSLAPAATVICACVSFLDGPGLTESRVRLCNSRYPYIVLVLLQCCTLWEVRNVGCIATVGQDDNPDKKHRLTRGLARKESLSKTGKRT
jgi:hypothetical protein